MKHTQVKSAYLGWFFHETHPQLTKRFKQWLLYMASFSGKYIHDFDITPGRVFSTDQGLTFTNVSRDGCAKMCVEYSGTPCSALTYCQATSTCTITPLSPSQNRDKISVNGSCDLYNSKYILYVTDKKMHVIFLCCSKKNVLKVWEHFKNWNKNFRDLLQSAHIYQDGKLIR